jgi:hypothetical protein
MMGNAKTYRNILTANENKKGVLDVDTVKGCYFGMKNYPEGGCYGECYANKTAKIYGFDFANSVSREPSVIHYSRVFLTVATHHASWYRVGTFGDPSHDWENTVRVCEMLKYTKKAPVIITKHWIEISEKQLLRLKKIGAVFNTSVSALDTEKEIKHRTKQIERIKGFGVKSICRVVTCNFLKTNHKQEWLLSLRPTIDTPLRVGKNNKLVLSGEIIAEKNINAIGGGKTLSMHKKNIYVGHCKNCPDQCGVNL